MLSVTEIALIGIGSGLLIFMLITCYAYWVNLYDVTPFCRNQEPLYGQTMI